MSVYSEVQCRGVLLETRPCVQTTDPTPYHRCSQTEVAAPTTVVQPIASEVQPTIPVADTQAAAIPTVAAMAADPAPTTAAAPVSAGGEASASASPSPLSTDNNGTPASNGGGSGGGGGGGMGLGINQDSGTSANLDAFGASW